MALGDFVSDEKSAGALDEALRLWKVHLSILANPAVAVNLDATIVRLVVIRRAT